MSRGWTCQNCGIENEIPENFKRWVIQLYEAATGTVLLPKDDPWLHKRATQTQMRGDFAYCGAQLDDWAPVHWRRVTCPKCLARKR